MARRSQSPVPRSAFRVPRSAFLWLALGLAACSTNQPPQVLPIVAQTAYVGSRFELRVQGYDPEGETLVYSFACATLKLEGRAKIIRLSAGEALFTWTPLASDVGVHQVDFTVSDGQEWDAESVTVTVKPGTNPDTAPVFRKPLGEGTTLDLKVNTCIKLEVEVEDPDSTKVDLRQLTPLTGSSFKATGAYRAMFSWCPSAAQAAKQRHVLELSADDHDNPAVIKSYTVLIRSKLPINCPGTAPKILHTAPGPKTTLEDIKLSAVITDDIGLKGKPLLYYTTKKPDNVQSLDYSKLSQVTMKQLAPTTKPTTYTGYLPNPVKTLAAGQTRTVYYVVVAEDDDDAKGNCDHRTQSPAGDMHLIKVTRPATKACTDTKDCPAGKVCDKAGACVPDACTPKDTNGDKLYWEQGSCPAKHICPRAGPSTASSHCAKTCTKDADCQSGTLCKVFDTKDACGKAGSKVVGQPCTDFTQCKGKAQCLPWTGGYCSISDCDSDGYYSGKCPTGSACIPVPDKRFKSLEKHWLCLQLCKDAKDCRTGQGYTCTKMQDDNYVDRHVCKGK